jgi:hypothetical protein
MQRFLAEQGVYPAEPTTFLSDGGDTVRQAQGDFRQIGEPILDWFHIAMRMTQISQLIKGLTTEPVDPQDPPAPYRRASADPAPRQGLPLARRSTPGAAIAGGAVVGCR